jgi:predicted Ser/Thr protein kinase
MDVEFLALQDALAGEYSFERELGRGGMGVVYLAREVQLDRPVAIKVLPAALAARPDVRARFVREARTAAGLSHPNIVPIHRVGEVAGIPFFVMTFVEGPTLGERLRDRGPVSPATISQILRDVAQALGYAHGRGIVHRDVKPDNIILDSATGRAMVTDFGIATVAGELTEGPVAGTLGFVSPEQLVGEAADGRSDLYALGVVAHLALTGTMPGTEATRPAVVTVDMSPSLSSAIDRCLSRDPDRRFADAEGLVAALDAAHDASRAVTRSSLPPELRAWAGDQVPMLPLYGYLSFMGVMSTVGSFIIRSTFDGPARAVDMMLGLGIGGALLPAVPVILFQLRKARRALAAGYRLSDLRFALRTWRAERLAEVDRAAADDQGSWWRIASRVPVVSFGVSLASAGLAFADGLGISAAMVVSQAGMFVGLASTAVLSALGLPVVPTAMQRRLTGRARSWLWNGRLGNWLAERLTPKTGGVPLAAFRPTEMALEVAIDDLFAALPEAYRESLSDLPAVARRLTARATALRETTYRAATVAGLSSAADQASRGGKSVSAVRLTETVTALERLRIGLLRLHGGLTDLQPVTTALEIARALDQDVARLVDAQAEVSGIRRVLGFESRSPSPA